MKGRRKEAIKELERIINEQQTVSVPKLRRLLEVIKWDRIEKEHNSLLSKLQKRRK